MEQMIDTLVFDFDGVIIDTEVPTFTAWQEVFESFGQSVDRALWSEIIGGGQKLFDTMAYLESIVGPLPDREAVRRRKNERADKMIAESPVLPGVLDHLADARRLGLRLAVASSSSRDWVEGHLAERGLLEYFAAIVTRDDVSRVKPNPALYATAVERVGSEPASAFAIEDSFNGVTSAKRAGLLCVAVPNEMTRDMDFDQADVRLGSLAEMPFEALLDRLEGLRDGSRVPTL